MSEDLFPVVWKGSRAIVAFPGDVNVGNAGQLRDQLLSVINRGAVVLIADMTGTVSCDHAAVDALARAYQRAAVSGTQLRLVVPALVIRRVLGIEGLDRLVSVYPTLEAAIAGEDDRRTQAAEVPGTEGVRAVTPAVLWHLIDALGDGLALVGSDGHVILANQRCAEIFGYRREELIGRPVDSLVPLHV